MPTFLFDSPIIGPIRSRRLGQSLGVNLLPSNGKLCNYDCIYCECGWNANGNPEHKKLAFNSAEIVYELLEKRLQELRQNHQEPDAITFSGNGEPTMHPQFPQIVDSAIALRNRHAPCAKVCVLTNATLVDRPEILTALKKVDRAMLKLDSGIDKTLQLINRPQADITVRKLIDGMKQFGQNLIVQSLFLSGEVDGFAIDNTSPAEEKAWLSAIKELQPSMVMLYTIERATPAQNLQKASTAYLQSLAEKVRYLGIEANVFV
ncbi:MAG: radical SAM protein [Prevotellaceae bacterium]|nr:radical SAM protein [Prevotellaceae bacterium]